METFGQHDRVQERPQIRAIARKGTVSPPDLTPTPRYRSQLDKEIITTASRTVKGQKLIAFFFAYHCLHSWSDIQMRFKEHLAR